MQLFHRNRKTSTLTQQHQCPRCDAAGIVQVADLVQGVDVIQCRACTHRWEIQRSMKERLAAAS